MESFEKAKRWSDFLGFHVRTFFFFVLTIFLARYSLNDLPDFEPPSVFARGMAIIGAVLFGIYSSIMLIRIQQVIGEFLTSHFWERLNIDSKPALLLFGMLMYLAIFTIASSSILVFALSGAGN